MVVEHVDGVVIVGADVHVALVVPLAIVAHDDGVAAVEEDERLAKVREVGHVVLVVFLAAVTIVGQTSEVDAVVVVGDVDEGEVAVRGRGPTRGRGRGRAVGHADHAEGGDGRRRGRRVGSGDGDHVLRFRGPAIVGQPTADHHGHHADQQCQHYVHFGVTCKPQ